MSDDGLARGSVPTGGDGLARGSVPTRGDGLARGSVPAAGDLAPVAVPQMKCGQVVIRSAAQYQKMHNCDVLVDLALTQRRIFTETEEDGRSEAVQDK